MTASWWQRLSAAVQGLREELILRAGVAKDAVIIVVLLSCICMCTLLVLALLLERTKCVWCVCVCLCVCPRVRVAPAWGTSQPREKKAKLQRS